MGSLGDNKVRSQKIETLSTNGLISASLPLTKTELPVWDSLNRQLPSRDDDKDFWWAVIGRHFATMMQEANYAIGLQYEFLLFHYFNIVPRMGPRPLQSGQPYFKSFMCDDFSPVEYSWRWDGDQPDVRFCVEPIWHLSGTPLDPFNQETMKSLLLDLEKENTSVDATLFWKFAPHLEPHSTDSGDANEWGSSIYTGFEFLPSGLGVKAYYMLRSPTRSAEFFNTSFTEVMSSIHDGPRESFEQLRNFLSTDPVGKTLNMILLAIDCVQPKDSRIKVYMRTPRTSFDDVVSIMTLGGRKTILPEQVKELKQLWYICLGLEAGFPTSQELPFNGHYTAGIPFYFDIKPGAKLPDVKGYIPVRHYAKSDAVAADGLCEFLNERGRGQYTAAYQYMLRGFASVKHLASRVGVQTFISFSFPKKGGLSLSSYLSPQVYSTLQETLKIQQNNMHA